MLTQRNGLVYRDPISKDHEEVPQPRSKVAIRRNRNRGVRNCGKEGPHKARDALRVAGEEL